VTIDPDDGLRGVPGLRRAESSLSANRQSRAVPKGYRSVAEAVAVRARALTGSISERGGDRRRIRAIGVTIDPDDGLRGVPGLRRAESAPLWSPQLSTALGVRPSLSANRQSRAVPKGYRSVAEAVAVPSGRPTDPRRTDLGKRDVVSEIEPVSARARTATAPLCPPDQGEKAL
jgi:hypothetical protein